MSPGRVSPDPTSPGRGSPPTRASRNARWLTRTVRPPSRTVRPAMTTEGPTGTQAPRRSPAPTSTTRSPSPTISSMMRGRPSTATRTRTAPRPRYDSAADQIGDPAGQRLLGLLIALAQGLLGDGRCAALLHLRHRAVEHRGDQGYTHDHQGSRDHHRDRHHRHPTTICLERSLDYIRK